MGTKWPAKNGVNFLEYLSTSSRLLKSITRAVYPHSGNQHWLSKQGTKSNPAKRRYGGRNNAVQSTLVQKLPRIPKMLQRVHIAKPNVAVKARQSAHKQWGRVIRELKSELAAFPSLGERRC